MAINRDTLKDRLTNYEAERDIHCYHVRPSFFEGVYMLFNFGKLTPRQRFLLQRSDYQAIQSVWNQVGENIYKAIQEFDPVFSRIDNDREQRH